MIALCALEQALFIRIMCIDVASSRIYRLNSMTADAVATKAASRIASAPPAITLQAAPNPQMLSSSPPPPFFPVPSPAPPPPLMSFPSGPAVTTAALIVAGNSPLPVSQALLGRTSVLVAAPDRVPFAYVMVEVRLSEPLHFVDSVIGSYIADRSLPQSAHSTSRRSGR